MSAPRQWSNFIIVYRELLSGAYFEADTKDDVKGGRLTEKTNVGGDRDTDFNKQAATI